MSAFGLYESSVSIFRALYTASRVIVTWPRSSWHCFLWNGVFGGTDLSHIFFSCSSLFLCQYEVTFLFKLFPSHVLRPLSSPATPTMSSYTFVTLRVFDRCSMSSSTTVRLLETALTLPSRTLLVSVVAPGPFLMSPNVPRILFSDRQTLPLSLVPPA